MGADDSGEVVLRELERENSGFRCVGLIDNDPAKRRLRIHGIPVLGTVADIAEIARQLDISFVIMAGYKCVERPFRQLATQMLPIRKRLKLQHKKLTTAHEYQHSARLCHKGQKEKN